MPKYPKSEDAPTVRAPYRYPPSGPPPGSRCPNRGTEHSGGRGLGNGSG